MFDIVYNYLLEHLFSSSSSSLSSIFVYLNFNELSLPLNEFICLVLSIVSCCLIYFILLYFAYWLFKIIGRLITLR